MNHREAATALIEWGKGGVQDLVDEISRFHRDEDEPVVMLSAHHVMAALRRLSNGEVSETDVIAWIEAVEGHDDIGYAEGQEACLAEALFELSSPELNGSMTHELAEHWIRKLSALQSK